MTRYHPLQDPQRTACSSSALICNQFRTQSPLAAALSFQSLTNCPICKPFALMTLQQYGGGYLVPNFQLRFVHPVRFAGTFEPSNMQTALFPHPPERLNRNRSLDQMA